MTVEATVYLNPPYARGQISAFAKKFLFEYDAARIEKAVLLTNVDTSTGWFRDLCAAAGIVGFFAPRIRFVHPETLVQAGGAQQRAQAIIGFNVSARLFMRAFADRCWFLE